MSQGPEAGVGNTEQAENGLGVSWSAGGVMAWAGEGRRGVDAWKGGTCEGK